ncbi:MAG: cytosine/adenosine deaminase, partial [Microbacterium sp.]|nr:cytosine/adenosine deaminase [Microbacterium sp.]
MSVATRHHRLMADTLDTTDLAHLRRAIELSQLARDHGNHPFG